MKTSDSNSKKSAKGLLPEKGNRKSSEQPAEEFISPDPSRPVPDTDTEETGGVDEMGISEKAKNQPSDESDRFKGK
ncbi:hypothetical protein [Aquiflexum sp.]|uniref:hypothetical protein n=1 Tax=Aquiflexum sp. TaxID=1872584 RepID=UPI0035931F88